MSTRLQIVMSEAEVASFAPGCPSRRVDRERMGAASAACGAQCSGRSEPGKQAAGARACPGLQSPRRRHRRDARRYRARAVIFVDSNVPMYLVGAPHPNRDRDRGVPPGARRQRLRHECGGVSGDVVHRCVAVDRRAAIADAFRFLDDLVTTVFPIVREDVSVAHTIANEQHALSARDCLHLAVMERRRGEGGPDLRHGVRAQARGSSASRSLRAARRPRSGTAGAREVQAGERRQGAVKAPSTVIRRAAAAAAPGRRPPTCPPRRTACTSP